AYRLYYYFFFSSRRRHTRWPRDWSSDVCSSDLLIDPSTLRGDLEQTYGSVPLADFPVIRKKRMDAADSTATLGLLEASRAEMVRSEERRVGKECRCGGSVCD